MSERKKIYVPEFDGDIPILEDEGKMQALRALRRIGESMKGEAERVGLDSEEKIVQFVKELRKERRERLQRESAV
ncbi:MAG: hypothetical protein IJ575_03565 [Selenomonadaceae bacterium]|nr:hypothetical protein [Selenomonadaceae bacterium]